MSTAIALPHGRETGPLAEELRTFERRKAEMLQTARGRFVLIKGDEIVGFYDDNETALDEGYRRFRLTGFLVQRVWETLDTYYVGGSALDITDEEISVATVQPKRQ